MKLRYVMPLPNRRREGRRLIALRYICLHPYEPTPADTMTFGIYQLMAFGIVNDGRMDGEYRDR